jgi:hypothetical protein
MKMSKFTPGPWESEPNATSTGYDIRGNKEASFFVGKVIIGSVWNDDPQVQSEVEANAHLMGAAPQLYEACQMVLEDVVDKDGKIKRSPTDTTINKLKEALATAEEGSGKSLST